jgi:hypothetical protein
MRVNPTLADVGCVSGFTAEHDFLSNDAPIPVTVRHRIYPSAGHAFAATAAHDPGSRQQVMAEIVRSKFGGDNTALLLYTDDDLLVDRNTAHDQDWGWCDCPRHRIVAGNNMLGRTLMSVRSEIRGDPPNRWVRAMVTGHRDRHFTPAQRAWMDSELDRIAAKLISEHGTRVAIHGGANGADLGWARAATDAGMEALWSYLPFPQQTEGWSDVHIGQWREMTTLRCAGGRSSRTEYLADRASVAALHARNEWMLRDSDVVIAVADPNKTTGGTVQTLRALGPRLPLIYLNVVDRDVRIRPADSAT